MDHVAALRSLKSIFKDKETFIDTDLFLDKLAEKRLISVAEEMEFKKLSYARQIDSAFFALLQRNPKPTYESVLEILEEMQRNDLKERLLSFLGKPSSQHF